MGVDEALLASAVEGIATLRFYGWEGPWLSLGYSQRLDPQRIATCADLGVGIIRRVTGGGAVLHGSDLTYSVAAPEAVLPPGLRGSFRVVADALIAGLRSLGVEAERSVAPSRGTASRSFDCFASSAEDEIRAEGRKLAGSAQRRMHGAVLQHGSIRLAPDPPEVTRAVGFTPRVGTSLAELGIAVQREEVQEALTAAFRSVLGTSLEESFLTASERHSALRRVEIHRGELLSTPRNP
jgi:lipoate-protein ligase A